MKHLFSKKSKLLASLGAGLLGATAIVTPLAASCSSSRKSGDITGFDKQYNISKVTYTHLQDSVASEYRAKLQQEGKYTSAEIVKKVGEARDAMKNFHKRARSLKNGLGYYQLTDSLIDFAKNEFGVDVEREFNETSINWTLENEKFKASLKDSLKNALRIDNFSSSETKTFLENFDKQFTNINNNLSDPKSKDFIKDPLKRFHQLKSDSILCFDDINDELTQLCANAKMKDFNKRHSFSFDQTTKPTNNKVYFEDLKGKFKINEDITTFVENNFQIFDISDKSYKDFKLDKLISNFKIVPLFKGLSSNPAANQYSMMIDWVYVRADKFEKMHTPTGEIDMNVANSVAAHSATLNETLSNSNDLFSSKKLSDIYKADDSKKDFAVYNLPVKLETEQNALKTEYLDKITFEWDTRGAPANDKYKFCKYEPFFGVHAGSKVGNATDNFTKLNASDLAEIGLRLSEKATPGVNKKLDSERLDKLLNLMKISQSAKKMDKLRAKSNKSSTLDKNDFGVGVLENFVLNCDIKAHSTIIDDNKHDVANTLYISFKNSSFTDSEKWKMIGEEDAFHCTGMPISYEFYKTVKKEFDKVKTWADQLRNQEDKAFSEPLKKVVHPAWYVSVGICTVLMLLGGIGIYREIRSNGFKKTFTWDVSSSGAQKASQIIGIIQCVLAFLGGCIALGLITLLLGESLALLEFYIEWCENKRKFEGSKNYKDLMKKIDDDYEQKFKDYNRFKFKPMETILNDLNFYRNISDQPLYKEFIKDWHNFHLSVNDITKLALPRWVNIFNKTTKVAAVIQFIHMGMSIVAGAAQAVTLSLMTKQLGMGVCFSSNMATAYSRFIGNFKRSDLITQWKAQRRVYIEEMKNDSMMNFFEKYKNTGDRLFITETGINHLRAYDGYMLEMIRRGITPEQAKLKNMDQWNYNDFYDDYNSADGDSLPANPEEGDSTPAGGDSTPTGGDEQITPKGRDIIYDEDYYEKLAEKIHDSEDVVKFDPKDRWGIEDESSEEFKPAEESYRKDTSKDGSGKYVDEDGERLDPDKDPDYNNHNNQTTIRTISFNEACNFVQVSGSLKEGDAKEENTELILLRITSPVEIAATKTKWMKDYKMGGTFDWLLRKTEDFSYDENEIIFAI